MRHTIRFAPLAFCLSFLFCATASRGQAPVDDLWYVLERVIPAPVSRSDWIAVGRSDAQRDGWRITRAPTSFALASAQADANRLSDRFKIVCDKGFNVYQDPLTKTLSVSRGPVGSQILQRTGLCCEDAFELAFPTPSGAAPATSDCRTLGLLSVPGAFVRWTPPGWRSTSGTPIPIPLVPPMWIPPANAGPIGGGSCQTVQRINQAESRDASGRISVEAATIHVMNCQSRGQIYIYQYLNRPGFRAIRPPDWGHAIGNRDFPTFEQAQQAASGGEGPVISQPVNDKDSIFWGTWNGTGNAKGITVTFNQDYSMTFNDARPGYVRNGGGKWHRDPDRIDCVGSPINYSLWYKNGTLTDPWGNLYTK